MVLIITGCIVVGVCLIYLWVKAFNAVFNPLIRKVNKNSNPYITAHKVKFKNDKDYDNYLRWLNKKGGDMPIDKLKSIQELQFEKQLNS